MTSGWPPMRGYCRCGCWPSELGCGPGSRRRCAGGFSPLYDRGQILADLALVLIAGGEAISDFQALAHLAPLIGPVPSAPTVWRALAEAGELQLSRLNAAVVEFRRHWRDQLAARPEGFPWLRWQAVS